MMWPQNCSLMVLAVGLFLLCLWPTQTEGARRFNCRRFCMRTGFPGTVGGCRCQFTLFTNKRGFTDDMDSRLAKRAFPPRMEEHLDELPQFSDLTKADILALSHQVPNARAKLLYPYLAGLNDAAAADYQDNDDLNVLLDNVLANEVPAIDNAPDANNAPSHFDVSRLANQITESKSDVNSSTNQVAEAMKETDLPEPNQLVISRKELKEQLENGNDSDYIRLSFH